MPTTAARKGLARAALLKLPDRHGRAKNEIADDAEMPQQAVCAALRR
ncbi:hypothetical protein [Kitasatospora sp. NPDC098663]